MQKNPIAGVVERLFVSKDDKEIYIQTFKCKWQSIWRTDREGHNTISIVRVSIMSVQVIGF